MLYDHLKPIRRYGANFLKTNCNNFENILSTSFIAGTAANSVLASSTESCKLAVEAASLSFHCTGRNEQDLRNA